jgi:hypothetical protein
MEVYAPMASEPDIEPIAHEQHKETPKETSRAFFTLRTMLSALIFGGLGWGLGKFIGGLGERGEHDLGRKVLSRGFGIGGAILAAYISTKTAREENSQEVPPAPTPTRKALLEPAIEKPIEQMPPATETPGSAIVAAEHAGVVENLDQKRAV